MATQELAIPSERTTEVVWNDDTSAIPHGTGVIYETVAGKTRAVKTPAAAGGILNNRAAGIAWGAIPAGGYGEIVVDGYAEGIVGSAALVSGDLVYISDTNLHMGELEKVATSTSQVEVIGVAASDEATQGQYIVVRVVRSAVAT